MKRILLSTAGLLLIALICHGQGTVNFSTRVSGTVVGHIYSPEPANVCVWKIGNTASETPAGTQTYGGVLLMGSGYTAQLWAAPGADQPMSALQPVPSSLTTFRTGATLGGTPSPIVVVVPGIPAGGTGTFQVRAWDNQGGIITSWSGVILGGGSPLFNVSNLGDGVLTLPANLNGFQSFNIYAIDCPEPGTYALIGLGGLGLWLARQRKPSV